MLDTDVTTNRVKKLQKLDSYYFSKVQMMAKGIVTRQRNLRYNQQLPASIQMENLEESPLKLPGAIGDER
jgi:hypothetical protein